MNEEQARELSQLSACAVSSGASRSPPPVSSMRRWRRRVAASADRPPDSAVRTVKMPLDVELSPELLEPSVRLSQVLDGSGHGSLLRLLLTTHLAGFRLFESVAKASAWRQRSAFGNEEFVRRLESALGEPLRGLDPEQIDLFLRSPVRKAGPFEPAVLGDRLAVRLAVSVRAGPPGERLRSVCDRLASGLCAAFPDWSAMYADPRRAKRCIDQALAGIAPGLPSLDVELPSSGGIDAPIAFDPALVVQGPWPEEDLVALRIVLSRGAREARLQGRAPAAGGFISIAQDYLLTRGENALSWLFNKGWLAFRDADPRELARAHDAPEAAQDGFRRLVDAARALPARPPLFSIRDYASFRRRFGWRMRTWIAQDLRRLLKLRERAAEEGGVTSAAISAMPPGPSELGAALLARHRSLEDLLKVCDRFLGAEPSDPTANDAAALDSLVAGLDALDDAFRSRFGTGAGASAREAGSRRADAGRSASQPGLPLPIGEVRWKTPTGLPEHEADPTASARTLAGRFDSLFRLQAALLSEALASARGGHSAWLATRERLEARRLPRDLPADRVRAFAVRRALQELMELARALPEPLRLAVQSAFRAAGVLDDARTLNRLFVNRQGRLFVTSRSTWRHGAVAIDELAAARADWFALLLRLEQLAAARVEEGCSMRDVEALLALRDLRLRWSLDASPEEVEPSSREVRQLARAAGTPEEIQSRIAGGPGGAGVTRAARRDMARWVLGELFALLPEATQPTWTARHSFTRLRSIGLLYVPKDRPWRVPQRYLEAQGPIGDAARLGLLGDTAGEEAGSPPVVSPTVCLEKLLSRPVLDLASAHAMRQIPHDWYLASGLVGAPGEVRSGLVLEQCPLGRAGAGLKLAAGVARLIGPGVRKAGLDRMIVDPGIGLGDVTLVLEWRFRQSFRIDPERNRYTLERHFDSGRLYAALPVDDASAIDAGVALVDRMLAIDLGAQGFSWAVFDLRAHMRPGSAPDGAHPTGVPGLLATGSEVVPSMRALSRAVERIGERVRAGVLPRLERLHAHAVADSCQRIELLCARFEAFPVLESLRAAFDGGTPLTHAYSAIVRRYTYSIAASHLRERGEYWFGAVQWTHPYLNTPVPGRAAADADLPRLRPVHLFPGAAVDPSGTSQACPRCGRNPISALRRLARPCRPGPRGELVLSDGMIRLAQPRGRGAGDLGGGGFRMKGRGWNEATSELDRLIAQAKALLREPVAGKHSSSVYRCLYEDCGCTGNSDEFAAINIGRKFLAGRVAPDLRPL